MRSWQPGTDAGTLRLRANLYSAIRAFFARRGVLEVSTPVLTRAGVTDVTMSHGEAWHFGRLELAPGLGHLLPLTLAPATWVTDAGYEDVVQPLILLQVLVLGPLAEGYFMTSVATHGTMTVFFTRPYAATILALAFLFVAWSLMPRGRLRNSALKTSGGNRLEGSSRPPEQVKERLPAGIDCETVQGVLATALTAHRTLQDLYAHRSDKAGAGSEKEFFDVLSAGHEAEVRRIARDMQRLEDY